MATLTITVTVPGAAANYTAVANDFLQGLKQKGIFKEIAQVAGQMTGGNQIAQAADNGTLTASVTFS